MNKKPHIIEPSSYVSTIQFASGPAIAGRKSLWIEILVDTENLVMFRVDHNNESRWTSDFDEAVRWYNES